MKSTLALCSVLLLATACRTAEVRDSLRPIDGEHPLEIGYRAEWTERGLEAHGAEASGGGATATGRFHACLARVSEADLRALLGLESTRLAAFDVDAAQLDALSAELRSRPAAVLAEQDLEFAGGSAVELRVAKSHAFIPAFEVQQSHDCLVADPIIDVADAGLLLRVSPAAGETAGGLSFEFATSMLSEPAREHAVRPPGSGAAIALGRPMFLTQRVRVESSGAPGRGVLIAGLPLSDGDGALLVIVRVL